MAVECFWIEPTDRVRLHLRRYRDGSHGECPAHGYHTAMTPIGEADRPIDGLAASLEKPDDYEGDERWPTHCECGEPFADEDRRQVFNRRIYRRADTGEEVTLEEAPPGAMWDADWWPRKGPDGRCLMVKCPDGHEWMIDGRANNCTMPEDNEHRCWNRTGEPPRITAGKSVPGQTTCGAGAGSIATPGYHGFLRDGAFT